MTTENLPVEITLNLIKNLRRNGRGDIASKLLTAWKKSKEKEKKEILNKIIRKDRTIKKHFGICISNSCKNLAKKDCVKCEEHLRMDRKYERKYRRLKKQKK